MTSTLAPSPAEHDAPSERLGLLGRWRRGRAEQDAAKAASGTKPHTQTRGEYRPDIDGIRGAAAIMVMGFHAKVPGFEGAYIGLDLFFVVSGYVITGLLIHEYQTTGGIRWGAFYARRARRLIPAKATMLIVVLAVSYFLLTPTGAQQQTARSAAAAAGFVSNFFFMNADDVDYFAHQPGTGVLLHTWSLSVEEQFYLSLPILILLAVGLARLLRQPVLRMMLFATAALAVGSLLVALAWSTSNPDAAYYMAVSRAFEFLLGVALALVARKVRLAYDLREVLGLAGIALCALVIWKPMPTDGYPSYWALVPCLGAVLMVWAGVGGPTIATRFLSMKLLVWLGLVSYGWYLWHWPFLVIGESVNLAPPPLYVRVLLILGALGTAYLSYRFIEGLFYKRSGSTSTRPTWGSGRVMISGVVAMSCVAGLSGGAFALAESEQEDPHWQTVSQQLNDVPAMPSDCLGPDAVIPDKPGRCDLVPYEPGRSTIVLWGDSHAWMYIPAIEAAARRRDVNLVAFTMGACPPFLPPDDVNIACARSNRAALDFVTGKADGKFPPLVILSASVETYRGTPTVGFMQERNPERAADDYISRMAGYYENGSPALFDALKDLGVRVDVVGPTPIIPRNAPLCEARARPFSCDVPRSDAIIDEAENVAWLRDQMEGLPAGSRYIDVARALCPDDVCFAENEGVVNYFDDNHLSATISRRLKRFFAPSIRDYS
ncbi:acyltransferase family protein [Nocardioides sp.]|uniref:acyltransferase family protein n=1 Tax=Nocardioides sp. TaxID=35761 RepID=UPI00351674E7